MKWCGKEREGEKMERIGKEIQRDVDEGICLELAKGT